MRMGVRGENVEGSTCPGDGERHDDDDDRPAPADGPGAPSRGDPRGGRPTLRRLRTLLLVVTITIPLFLVAIVAVLWHLAQ